MDASYKIQRGIHVHLIQFFMCPEFWVHIIGSCVFIKYMLLQSPVSLTSQSDNRIRVPFESH